TVRPTIASRAPPKPTAPNPAAIVSSTAVAIPAGWPTSEADCPSEATDDAGAPCQMVLTAWYGPTSAARIVGATEAMASIAAGPAASSAAVRRGIQPLPGPTGSRLPPTLYRRISASTASTAVAAANTPAVSKSRAAAMATA